MAFYMLIGLFQLVALLIFALGFFPSKTPIPGYATHESQALIIDNETMSKDCSDKYLDKQPALDRLVIIVIDALRKDFLLHRETPMSFVRSVIENGHGLAFDAHVQSPTVTMPRIKAFTSGTVPAFADLVLNLASSDFIDDSIVAQLVRKERRVIFYGDDTWLQLFPTAFLRSEGTVSFFVKDYTEVDNNVTRHLDLELELEHQDSWDVMILHYLGLDHIGHSLGSQSSVLPVKLREMDGIIRTVYNSLSKTDRSFGMVILGDHGMTDAGSHGGSTDQETSVPLVFLSPHIQSSSAFPDAKRVEQIDLVPTVSALLGLPIPQNSLGATLLEVLLAFNTKESPVQQLSVLMSIHANAVQIGKVDETSFGTYKRDKLDQLTRKSGALLSSFCLGSLNDEQFIYSLIHDYINLIHDMQGRLLVSFADYDMPLIFAGLGMSLTVTLSLILRLIFTHRRPGYQPTSFSVAFLYLGLVLHVISLFASSFVEEEHQIWYWMLPSYFILFGFECLALIHRKDSQYKYSMTNIAKLAAILVLHRIFRAWNQTGDKWAHLPDIGDWLNQPGRQLYLTSFGILSLCLIILLLLLRDGRLRKMHFLCISGPLLVALAHFVTERSVWNVRLVWLAVCSCILSGQYIWGIVMWIILLMKPHNLSLICGLVLQGRLLSSLNIHPLGVYFAMAASFFYTGNSNSLASLDVSAGYVGLTGYHPVPVGLQMLVTTYAGPLLLSSLTMKDMDAHIPWLLVARCLATSATLLALLLLRGHLFVWSVFAPKLLFEASHTALVVVLIVVIRLRALFIRIFNYCHACLSK